MVLTRLSHAGGSCPLGKDKQDNCFECSSEESGPSQAVPSGRAPLFQKPLPPKRVVPFHLLDLPVEVLEKIFSTLSFGEVSRVRMVSVTGEMGNQASFCFDLEFRIRITYLAQCMYYNGVNPVSVLIYKPFYPVGVFFFFAFSEHLQTSTCGVHKNVGI